MVGGLSLVVVAAGFASVVPWLLRRAVDDIRLGAPARTIWLLAGAMVGVSMLGGTARYGMRQVLNGVSRWIEYDLRNDLFAALERLDSPYFGRMRTGDLMARVTNDLSAVRMAAGPAIMYLTNTVAGGLFALAFMVRIDVRLTAIALASMVLLPVMTISLGRRIHQRFEAVQAHFSDLTTMAQENLAGVRIVRAFRQESAETARFARLNDEYLTKNMRLAQLYGMMQPGFSLFAGAGMVAVLAVGGALVLRRTITVGSYVAFGMYLGMLTWPLIALGYVINLFQRGAASMNRLLDILEAKPVLRNAPGLVHLPPSAQGRMIEFRDVGFCYPGQPDRWVLRHISFTAPAGATIGVVGATGSGKSALMDLIPRLYDPQEGEILIDGLRLQDLPLDELRAEIGYVPQDSVLFSDTIQNTLSYGTSDDDEEAARWAAKIAQLDETVGGFPGGDQTILGERGINLSGGQKQRAALARALARRPNVVLLDDALSAVDTHTEAQILQSLREALAGRTALIASHRISAIRDASWTIVLDEGRLVEEGRHGDLLAAHGRYWALLNRQQLEEAIETDDGRPQLATAESAD